MCSVLLVCTLAECNRVPFDLPEAESELVAGFLTEYSAIPFILYQLAEYISIIFSMCLVSYLYFSSFLLSLVFITLVVMFRSSYPRFKYDQLISLCWQDIAVLALSITSFLSLQSF